ncbi:MAG: Tat pathway signal sequence [Lachnospiraceae bacterium]|jgi:uncharacterized membrane protein YczE|nr:Tat pathway signal sequence [Lachnospiraceae bacterium]
MSQKTKRILMAFFGVIVTGFCVGTFQKASLGTDPFTCFVTGIGNIFGSTYSTFYVIVTGALLIGVFLVEKHYIGIATVINLFGTGISADLMRNLWDVLVPNPGMGVRAMLVVLGVVGSCFSASMYFTADLGVSAYDAISLIAANKYKLMAFRVCRVLSDLICVTVGVIFHANVGIGTVITALFMGPVIQWFNTHVSEPFLYGSSKAASCSDKVSG